jgi:hypothetical protein
LEQSRAREGRRSRTALALVCGAAVACVAIGTAVAWAGSTYLALVELEVEVTDAAARFEAARLGRAALVENLLEAADDHWGPDAGGRLGRIAELAERAEAIVLPRPVWRHPLETRAVEIAQQELSEALGELRLVPDPSGADEVVAVDELARRIARASEQLDDALGRLEHSLDSYERAIGTFPASLFAGIAGHEPDGSETARSPG